MFINDLSLKKFVCESLLIVVLDFGHFPDRAGHFFRVVILFRSFYTFYYQQESIHHLIKVI